MRFADKYRIKITLLNHISIHWEYTKRILVGNCLDNYDAALLRKKYLPKNEFVTKNISSCVDGTVNQKTTFNQHVVLDKCISIHLNGNWDVFHFMFRKMSTAYRFPLDFVPNWSYQYEHHILIVYFCFSSYFTFTFIIHKQLDKFALLCTNRYINRKQICHQNHVFILEISKLQPTDPCSSRAS